MIYTISEFKDVDNKEEFTRIIGNFLQSLVAQSKNILIISFKYCKISCLRNLKKA